MRPASDHVIVEESYQQTAAEGLLGAARLALRVALWAIAIAAARRCRRTLLLSVGGSNGHRIETGNMRRYLARGLDMPAEGFEPPTYGLQNRCTTTVLSRRGGAGIIADLTVGRRGGREAGAVAGD
jgi:hypothetical protein